MAGSLDDAGDKFENEIDRRHGYHTLDGMRGVAAIAVLIFHAAQWVEQRWLAPHGYLAVDFFFCLSGFVIASAYGRRAAEGMSLRRFTTIRLVRFYPMILVGLLLGFLYYSARVATGKLPGVSLTDTVTALMLGALMIPNMVRTPMGHNIFPLNGVQWSLFFELAVNLAWLVLRPILSVPVLIAIALVSAAILLSAMSSGQILGAFGGHHGFILLGIPRTAYSFCTGLLIFELLQRRPGLIPRLPAELLLLVLAALLTAPTLAADVVYQGSCLFLLLPAVVLLGTRARILLHGSVKLCTVLGLLSYPLYAVHRPIFAAMLDISRFAGYRAPGLGYAFVVSLIICGISWIMLHYYEAPVRRFLETRLRLREPSSRAPRETAPAVVK